MPGGIEFLIALGANLSSDLGGPEITLRTALKKLNEIGAKELISSRLYETPCFPQGAGPDYVNAAARLWFDGAPQDLLQVLHRVEAEFGRERIQRWGQRTLDLDLLAAGNAILPDREEFQAWFELAEKDQLIEAPNELILPHPRLQDRAFVLVPLAEIAPEWRHPILGETVVEMRDKLPQEMLAEVRLL